jgi:hypothetical protein
MIVREGIQEYKTTYWNIFNLNGYSLKGHIPFTIVGFWLVILAPATLKRTQKPIKWKEDQNG